MKKLGDEGKKKRKLLVQKLEDRRLLTFTVVPQTVPSIDFGPSNATTIYLDFDGHSEGGVWHNDVVSCASIPVLTPIVNGLTRLLGGQTCESRVAPTSARSFLTHNQNSRSRLPEETQIRAIAEIVAEDFAPWNARITTDASHYNPREDIRVVIGYDINIDSPGQARPGSASLSRKSVSQRTVFVEAGELGGETPFARDLATIANIVSHEVGHVLGLEHRSDPSDNIGFREASSCILNPNNDQCYLGPTTDAEGNSVSAIMGSSSSGRSTWSNGLALLETGRTQTIGGFFGIGGVTYDVHSYQNQDAVSILDDVLGKRRDDIGNSFSSATQISNLRPPGIDGVATFTFVQQTNGRNWERGIIETRDDKDFFAFHVKDTAQYSFQVEGGYAYTLNNEFFSGFTANTGFLGSVIAESSIYSNANFKLTIYDQNRRPVKTFDPRDSFGVEEKLTLTRGDYYAEVSSSGEYGSLGQYVFQVFPPELGFSLAGSAADDFPNTQDGAEYLADGSASGNVTPGDHDWVSFDVVEGVRYRINDFDQAFASVDAQFSYPDSLIQTESVGNHEEFTASETGIAYGRFSGTSQTADFEFDLQPVDDIPDGTVAAISVGDSVSHFLEIADDTDQFEVQLAAGQQIVVQLPQNRDGANFEVRSEAGDLLGIGARPAEEVGGSDHHDAAPVVDYEFIYESPITQTILIGVAGGATDATRRYTLAVNSYVDDHGDDSVTATSIAENELWTGESHFTSDEDWFAFPVTAGIPYSVQIASIVEGAYTLSTFASDQTLIGTVEHSEPGKSEFIFQATEDSTIYVSVNANGPNQGLYGLIAAEVPDTFTQDSNEPNNTAATATPIQFGPNDGNNIHNLVDVDFFTFTATETAFAEFIMFSSDFSSELVAEVSDSSGSEIEATQSDFRRFYFPVVQGESYVVQVSTTGLTANQGYSINQSYRYEEDHLEDGGFAFPLTIDQTIEDLSIHSGNDFDGFYISPNAGDVITIDIQFDHSQGDLNLSLVEGDGRGPIGLISQSSTSETDNESITFTADGSELVYLINVSADDFAVDANRNYTLSVTGLGATSTDRAEPNNDSGNAYDLGNGAVTFAHMSIGSGGDRDFFQWTAPFSSEVQAHADHNYTAGAVAFDVYDSAGELLTSSYREGQDVRDESNVATLGDWLATEGETYLIEVFAPDLDENVGYSLSVGALDSFEQNNEEEDAAALHSGDVVLPRLSLHGPRDEDWYRWTAPLTGTLNVEAIAANTDQQVEVWVFDEERDQFTTNFGGVASLDVDENTDYWVRVFTYDGALDYSLSLDGPGGVLDDGQGYDDPATPYVITSTRTEVDNLSIHEASEDYFTISLRPGESVRSLFEFNSQFGDLDALLFDFQTDEFVAFSLSTTDDESIDYFSETGGDYAFVVLGYDGATNPFYRFTVERFFPADELNDNNTRATATELFGADVELAALTISEHDDDDFYRWTAPADTIVDIFAAFDHSVGDLDVVVTDEMGQELGGSYSVSDEEFVSLSVSEGDVLYIHVYGFNDAISDGYSLSVDGGDIFPDVYELNNGRGSATDLLEFDNFIFGANIHSFGDQDWYRWETDRAGELVVDLITNELLGSIDVELLDANLAPVSAIASDDVVSRFPVVSGEYYVRAFSPTNDENPFYSLSARLEFPEDALEPNDDSIEATPLAATTTLTDLSISSHEDEDFFVWTADIDAVLDISLAFDYAMGDIDVDLLSADGNTFLARAESNDSNENLQYDVVAGEQYLIRVYGYQGSINPSYGLTVDRTELIKHVVNTTSDGLDANVGNGIAADANGLTSFRSALQEVSRLGRLTDTIVKIDFDIPADELDAATNRFIIQPNVPLPLIVDPVTITTAGQRSAADQFSTAEPLVEIDGSLITFANSDGLKILGDDVHLDGLAFSNFSGDGIEFIGSAGSSVTGLLVRNNGGGGIRAVDSSGIMIAGSTIIDNARSGIQTSGSTANITIQGNDIGVVANELGDYTVAGNGVYGIHLLTPNNVVAGNVVGGNSSVGIAATATSADSNTIIGNLVGTDFAGNDLGNGSFGVLIRSGSNVVGGNSVSDANVISGNNRSGLVLSGAQATNNEVYGNFIGTDVTGTQAVPNTAFGILVSNASLNRIGSTQEGHANVISGNHGSGVSVGASHDNVIEGNTIGLDVTGTSALANAAGVFVRGGAKSNTVSDNLVAGNSGTQVLVVGGQTSGNVFTGNAIGFNKDFAAVSGGATAVIIQSPNNVIGGSDPSDTNYIRGSNTGITLNSVSASGNVIQGNRIGTDDDQNDFGMTTGIQFVGGANFNTVGPDNHVLFNSGDAIRNTTGGVGNQITQNVIAYNGFGIDLAGNNQTANDPDDADEGPNLAQNTLESIDIAGSIDTTTSIASLEVTYHVDSDPSNSSYPLTVEFFAETGGQGVAYLGSDTFTAADHSAGTKTFNFGVDTSALPVLLNRVVATVTDSGFNTSEFSIAYDVGYTSGASGNSAGQLATNQLNPLDVDGNGTVSSLDALLVINQLNSTQASGEAVGLNQYMYDVNGDNHVTALDALQVINGLQSPGFDGLIGLSTADEDEGIDAWDQAVLQLLDDELAALF